jgi:hypothetical protein
MPCHVMSVIYMNSKSQTDLKNILILRTIHITLEDPGSTCPRPPVT